VSFIGRIGGTTVIKIMCQRVRRELAAVIATSLLLPMMAAHEKRVNGGRRQPTKEAQRAYRASRATTGSWPED
jgi:hypothetical protein